MKRSGSAALNGDLRQGNALTYRILTSKRPGLSRGLPPGKEDLAWVANSATLISGQRDAVLVDTFLTSDQARILTDWVVASGKKQPDQNVDGQQNQCHQPSVTR